jgi:hypothetical protein
MFCEAYIVVVNFQYILNPAGIGKKIKREIKIAGALHVIRFCWRQI